MKKRLLAFALLLAAPLAFAQQPAGAKIAKYLQLTPDQILAWKQINQDTRATLKPLVAAAHEQQKELKAALEATNPDPTTVGNLALTLHATRERIRGIRSDAQSKRLAVLNPDQQAKFEGLLAARRFMKKNG